MDSNTLVLAHRTHKINKNHHTQGFRYFIMLGVIEVDLFTESPAALTHLFKVNRICTKSIATSSLRKN